MEVSITKSEDKSIEVEIKGEDHTFSNFLRKGLCEVENVKDTGYRISHPLVSSPRISVRVESGKPKKAFDEAADLLRAKIKELRTFVKKL